MMKRLIEWAWGDPTMKIVRIRFWWPSIGPWGIEWPGMITDRGGQRAYSFPVWNWTWFRNRIGWPAKEPSDRECM